MSKKIHISYSNQAFSQRIEYIIDFLRRHPHCPNELVFTEEESQADIKLHYGTARSADKAAFYIPAQQLIFSSDLPDASKLNANTYRFDRRELYSVEDLVKKTGPFFRNNTFGFDLFEMLFFHLSRFEEYHCRPEEWDEWEMMHSDRQFLVRHRLHQQPVVDTLVSAFFSALGFEVPRRPAEYRISHDIDVFRKFTSLYQLARSSAAVWLKGRGISGQTALLQAWFATKWQGQQDPFDTFDWLLSQGGVGEKYLYLLSGGVTAYDRFYQIEKPFVPEVIRMARERGYTIGLHPSYAACRDGDLLMEEKSRLEKITGMEVRDSRQHFLHFDHRKTLSLLEEANMLTDSTLGYQDKIGFRCGTGYSFQLYDLNKERESAVKEIPMVVMDSAILFTIQDDTSEFQKQLQSFLSMNKEGTRITFNFHNSTFDPLRLDARALRSIYENLVMTKLQ